MDTGESKFGLIKNHGLIVNHKAVLRIMRKAGIISAIRRRRQYRHLKEQLHKYPNVFDRDFSADKLNTKWVTDITYIHTAQGSSLSICYKRFIGWSLLSDIELQRRKLFSL